MYEIERDKNLLRVRFNRDFDFDVIKSAIHHITMLKEYPHVNDIWVIGKHQAHIRLHELEEMVREFQCRCPQDATRTKTALVAERGMTCSIFELWINAVNKRVSFDLQLFGTLQEAEEWLEGAECRVA